MTLEEFNNLTPEEQTALLTSADDMTRKIADLEAERDSFRQENDSLKERQANLEKDLKETKTVNYTLARQINTAPEKDTETLMYEAFKRG